MTARSITKVCSIENCDGKTVGRDYCRKHYQRWWKHGDARYEPPSRIEQFWDQVEKSDGCWIWTGHTDEDGYGRLSIEGVRQFAHRLSFFLAYGHYPFPMARHTCDNPPCVRPDHIIEGTAQDNVNDRSERNRGHRPYGELAPWAKLTADSVRSIRARVESGELSSEVATDLNVSRAAVSLIVNRKRWAHI